LPLRFKSIRKTLSASRYIYQLQVPPSPASLAAIQASGAAILLTLASLPSLFQAPTRPSHQASQGTPSTQAAEDSHGEAGWPALASLLRVDSVEKAGAELGCWTFLANAATITAFQHTPASRGAFLIRQATQAYRVVVQGWTYLANAVTIKAYQHIPRQPGCLLDQASHSG